MSSHIGDEAKERIGEILFRGFTDTPAENFLRQELERYVPEMRRKTEEEITQFAEYQRGVYLEGKLPVLGRPVASLNPAFIDSLEFITLAVPGLDVYTRAAVKENGYRMQVHNGPQRTQAFTRQFTAYDLRMFPELRTVFAELPLMIGDAELINASHKHLAGFHRVNARLPDARHWPARGTDMIDDGFLASYLAQEDMFKEGMPLPEYAMTLAFHGMLAIADPHTWRGSAEEQMESLESLCALPMDYRRVDGVLDKLAEYVDERKIPVRVVQRQEIRDKAALAQYVKDREDEDLEGTIVVQCARDAAGERSFDFAKTFKIKKYETIDCALLGLYLAKERDGLAESNVTGALLGLYDPALRRYLAVHKTNLDPHGVQVKTDGQRERLTELRRQLVREAQTRQDAETHDLLTLYDAYRSYGRSVIKAATRKTLGKKDMGVAERMLLALQDDMPRGHTLTSLIEKYGDGSGYESLPKRPTKLQECLFGNKKLFDLLQRVHDAAPEQYETLMGYFSDAKDMRKTSQSFRKPQLLISTDEPVILETQVFDITRDANKYPAGYDPATRTCFKFNNAFADRIRHDKSSTTDYGTIERIARQNTA